MVFLNSYVQACEGVGRDLASRFMDAKKRLQVLKTNVCPNDTRALDTCISPFFTRGFCPLS